MASPPVTEICQLYGSNPCLVDSMNSSEVVLCFLFSATVAVVCCNPAIFLPVAPLKGLGWLVWAEPRPIPVPSVWLGTMFWIAASWAITYKHRWRCRSMKINLIQLLIAWKMKPHALPSNRNSSRTWACLRASPVYNGVFTTWHCLLPLSFEKSGFVFCLKLTFVFWKVDLSFEKVYDIVGLLLSL